jgi:hypothetical protein
MVRERSSSAKMGAGKPVLFLKMASGSTSMARRKQKPLISYVRLNKRIKRAYLPQVLSSGLVIISSSG